jgi:hypothetical protein
MKNLAIALWGVVVVMTMATAAQALTVVPQSALGNNGGNYYTDITGGGIGNIVVMTGGGNANGVGLSSGRNDDGFSGPISLGFSTPLSFFGNSYSTFYANNNGNISFNSGISSFIPSGPTGASAPIISPFFADVDTRNSASGVMHLRTDAEQIIVTWDNVGYFNTHGSPFNSFQLVLRSANYNVPIGEGHIGFFYKDMGWERTDTSTTAAVGFGDGLGSGEVLAGSNAPGMASVLNDRFIWFDQNLIPVPNDNNPVPEPSTILLLGAGLAGLGIYGRKRMKV